MEARAGTARVRLSLVEYWLLIRQGRWGGSGLWRWWGPELQGPDCQVTMCHYSAEGISL